MKVLLRFRLEKPGYKRRYFEKQADIPEAALEPHGSFRFTEGYTARIENVNWDDSKNISVANLSIHAVEPDYSGYIEHLSSSGWKEVKE